MSINFSAISMFDTVETGREKINFLITADTSPFYFWSGTPATGNYLSVFRNNSGYINSSTSSINSSVFNLIFNGSENLIDTTNSVSNFFGSYNFISGVQNNIYQNAGSGNTVIGSLNTISSGNENFIHGSSNNINSSASNYLNTIISSSGSSYFSIFPGFNNIMFSSYNSRISNTDSSTSTGFIFLAGKNNLINYYNSGGYPFYGFDFIGNGYNNVKNSTSYKINSGDSTSIINGQNNSIINDYTFGNSILFGSNLTTVTDNYSHFENLYVNNSIFASYAGQVNISAGNQTAVTVDTTYSFFNVFMTNPSLAIDFAIKIPPGGNQIQFLTLLLYNNGFSGCKVYFVDKSEIGNFPNRLTLTPTQIASKVGSAVVGNSGNKMITNLGSQAYVAYFFTWIPLIQRWVMYVADTQGTF